MAWFNVETYVPPNVSGSQTPVGGGWSDPNSVWSIVNIGTGQNVLQVTDTTDSSPWKNRQLMRLAATEQMLNSRIRTRWRSGLTDPGLALWHYFRYSGSDSSPSGYIARTAGKWVIASGSLSGSQAIGSASGAGWKTANAWYDTEVVATTSGGTTTITEKTWTVTNAFSDAFASGTIVTPTGGNIYTDTQFSSAGAVGLFFYQPGTGQVASFSSDTDVAATALTISPSSGSGTGGTSINYTVGANGAQNGGSISLSDGGAGGTFSATTVTVGAGVGQTAAFTYAPASGASGTITITASSSALTGSAISGTATISISASAATVLAISPSSQNVVAGSASGAYTVSANGTLSSSTPVSLSDGSGGGTFSPTSLTLSSGTTSGTFTYTPASGTTGTKTLTAAATGLTSGTASAVVSAPPTIVAPNNAAVVASPHNWVTGLSNSSRSDNTAMRAWNTGAYLRIAVTGTTSLQVVFGASSTSMNFVYQIDEQLPSAPVSCLNNANYSITLPDTGAHTVTVMVYSTPQSTGRWAGTLGMTINGFVLGTGGALGTATKGNRTLLIYGDSITEGIQSRDGSDGVTTSYAYLIGEAFRRQGWEYSIKAAGSSGYAVAVSSGSGGQPPAWTSGSDTNSSWNKVDGSGATGAALTTGTIGGTSERFIVQPDLILDVWGTNDGLQGVASATVQATVTGLYQRLRIAAPNAVLLNVVPFGGYCRSAIQAAVSALSAVRTSVIDLLTDVRMTQTGYCGNLLTGASSGQSIHPWSLGSAALGNLLQRPVCAAYDTIAVGVTLTSPEFYRVA